MHDRQNYAIDSRVCDKLFVIPQIAKFLGPTWGPPGSYQPKMGPRLVLRSPIGSAYLCHGPLCQLVVTLNPRGGSL